jgi:hypothetical protein
MGYQTFVSIRQSSCDVRQVDPEFMVRLGV